MKNGIRIYFDPMSTHSLD